MSRMFAIVTHRHQRVDGVTEMILLPVTPPVSEEHEALLCEGQQLLVEADGPVMCSVLNVSENTVYLERCEDQSLAEAYKLASSGAE